MLSLLKEGREIPDGPAEGEPLLVPLLVPVVGADVVETLREPTVLRNLPRDAEPLGFSAATLPTDSFCTASSSTGCCCDVFCPGLGLLNPPPFDDPPKRPRVLCVGSTGVASVVLVGFPPLLDLNLNIDEKRKVNGIDLNKTIEFCRILSPTYSYYQPPHRLILQDDGICLCRSDLVRW